MKHVLVTGGCGYIGSHVSRQLCEAGFRVTVIDNLSTGFKENLVNGETLCEADLGDQNALENLFSENRFDAVLHFAASIVVPESVENPLLYYQNNTINTLKLLRTMKHHGTAKIVFSSTAAVYGENDAEMVDEEMEPKPANPYAQSKLMSEQMIKDTAAVGDLNYVILRYFNVAGAESELRMGQRFGKSTHLIKQACRALLEENHTLTVFGDDYPTKDGTGVRDYIHVEDLANAHLCALDHLLADQASLVLNCGYGKGYSVKEVIDSLGQIAGREVPHKIGPRRAGDISMIIAKVEQIKSKLKWQPKHEDLGFIVRSAFEWEKKLQSSN